MSKKDLIEKGWFQLPDGSWNKPRIKLTNEERKDPAFSWHVDYVDSLAANPAEPTQPQALARSNAKQQRSARCLARVSLVSYRRRIIGDDSLAYSCKALRDIIAQDLLGGVIGQMDDDGSLEWEYGQVKTKGREGVAVKIELI